MQQNKEKSATGFVAWLRFLNGCRQKAHYIWYLIELAWPLTKLLHYLWFLQFS
jgi:hypothetical protein